MLKIGYFSRISQVSVKTLRYYDKIGLFRPIRVDPYTSYRYYSVDQLPLLNRILALKDLGLSLEQVAQMLDGNVSSHELRGMLRLRRSQLQEQSRAVTAELARVEARLRQIEMEDKMPDYEIALKTVEPILVASRRMIIPTNDQVPAMLGPAFDEVCKYIQSQGGEIVGPSLAVWHSSPDVYSNEDVEAVYPIGRPIQSADHIKIYELLAESVAAVIHQGDFQAFTNGHKVLLKWIDANGYRLNGAYREIYHDCHDHQNATVEVQFPVVKV